MTFPPLLDVIFPGIVADPSLKHSVSGEGESPCVLKSTSHSCNTPISTSLPSVIFGVSISICTGFEKMRCSPGVPNSKTRGVAQAYPFRLVPSFFFPFSWNSFHFDSMFERADPTINVSESTIFPFLERTIVSASKVARIFPQKFPATPVSRAFRSVRISFPFRPTILVSRGIFKKLSTTTSSRIFSRKV